MVNQSFDYIILGAGSAGCVLANRLSADCNKRVLLIEAGGRDYNPWLHIPVGYFKTMHNPKYDWCYQTKKDEKNLNGRSIQWPRGRVLGGSSALNGLLYIRGDRFDYDHWAELGNQGWSYSDVLPYFIKSENQENGANDYHGAGGELSVANLRLKRKIADDFIKAAEQIGIPYNGDFNGANLEGVGYFQQTTRKGLRCSTATAFLKPIRKRKNLTVLTKAQVVRILFDNKKAIAVEYQHGGSLKKALANIEIIASAGAIGSAQILQLSGIGDGKHLKKLGIDVVHDNQAVGENLQDHLQVRLVYKTNQRTLNDELNSWWKKALIGVQYILMRTGPLTLSASQVAIFTHTALNGMRPNIQFHFQPLSADKPGEGVHPFSAFTMSVCLLRPKSRGSVKITSNDFRQKPEIIANYLSDENDRQLAIESIKVARKIAQAAPLKNFIIDEYVPGAHFQSDEQLLTVAKNHCQSIYHPVGTCKMGVDDNSVVDARLKVYGVQGLRVVDASIMPQITSGNTNAPSIMIAEKAADMIIADNKN